MNPEEAVDLYRKVTGDGADLVWSGKFSITLEQAGPICDQQRLRELLGQFSFTAGWLCCQSGIVRLRDGSLPEGSGHILYGELAGKDSNESLHIQQDGACWRVSRIREDDQDGQPCLVMVRRYHCSDREVIRYRVYLTRDAEAGFQARACRFVGFGEAGKTEAPAKGEDHAKAISA